MKKLNIILMANLLLLLGSCSLATNRSVINVLNNEIEFCESSEYSCTVYLSVTEYKQLSNDNYYDLMNQATIIQIANKRVSGNNSVFTKFFDEIELESVYFSIKNASINQVTRNDVSSSENAFVYDVYTDMGGIKLCEGELFVGSCISQNIVKNVRHRFNVPIIAQTIGEELPDFEDLINLDEGVTLTSIDFRSVEKNRVGKYTIEFSLTDEYEHAYSGSFVFEINPYKKLFTSWEEISDLTFDDASVLTYFNGRANSYKFLNLNGDELVNYGVSEVHKISDSKALAKVWNGNEQFYSLIDFTGSSLPQISKTDLNSENTILPQISLEGTLVFYKGNSYGVIDSEGTIIEPNYSMISIFDQKYYKLSNNGLYGLMNSLGEQILSLEFSSIEVISIDNNYFYKLVKPNGSIEIRNEDFMEDYSIDSNQISIVLKNDDGKYALKNGYGELLTEFLHTRIYQQGNYFILHEPFRTVSEGNKSVRTIFGELLLEPRYLDSLDIINDYAILKPQGRNELIIYDLLNNEEVYAKTNVTFQIKDLDHYGKQRYLVFREGNAFSSVLFHDSIEIIEDSYLISGNYIQSAPSLNVEIRTFEGNTIVRGREFNFAPTTSRKNRIRVISSENSAETPIRDFYDYNNARYLMVHGISSSNRFGGIVTEFGTIIIEFKYDEIIVDLINEIIVVKKSNQYGIYDMNGDVLVPLTQGKISHISGNIYQIDSAIVSFTSDINN